MAKYILEIVRDEFPEDPRNWDNLGTMVCWHRRYNLGDKHDYKTYRDFLEDFATYFSYTEAYKQIIKEYFEIRVSNDGAWEVISKTEWVEDVFDSEEDAVEFCHEAFIEQATDEELFEIIKQNTFILPLYLYDHSGLTISTKHVYPYNDRWDAGQVGWIFVTKEKAKKELPNSTDEELEKKVIEILEGEVEEYDCYLTGEVYGFVIKEEEKCECCGHVDYDIVESCFGFYGNDFEKNGLYDAIPEEYRHLLKEQEVFV